MSENKFFFQAPDLETNSNLENNIHHEEKKVSVEREPIVPTKGVANREEDVHIVPPSVTIRFCTSCGKQLNAASQFCTACGKPVNGKTESNKSLNNADISSKRTSSKSSKGVLTIVLVIIILLVGIFVAAKFVLPKFTTPYKTPIDYFMKGYQNCDVNQVKKAFHPKQVNGELSQEIFEDFIEDWQGENHGKIKYEIVSKEITSDYDLEDIEEILDIDVSTGYDLVIKVSENGGVQNSMEEFTVFKAGSSWYIDPYMLWGF